MTDILEAARAKAQYIKDEVHTEFHRFERGTTSLTPQTLKVFEKKWLKELRTLDNKLLAATLSPESQHLIGDIQNVMDDLRSSIASYIELLKQRYG